MAEEWTITDLYDRLESFEADLRRQGLSDTMVETYIDRCRLFLRWLAGGYPGDAAGGDDRAEPDRHPGLRVGFVFPDGRRVVRVHLVDAEGRTTDDVDQAVEGEVEMEAPDGSLSRTYLVRDDQTSSQGATGAPEPDSPVERSRSGSPRLGPYGSLADPCPTCGHTPVAAILWGMPAGPPDGEAEGYVVLGGCTVTGDDPTHQCANCGTEFWEDGRVRTVDERRTVQGW